MAGFARCPSCGKRMFTVGDVRSIAACPDCGARLFDHRSPVELERFVQERLYGEAPTRRTGNNPIAATRNRIKPARRAKR
jgi:tRNA(Ile2) C34 agmatinyltransferase TiaS